MIGFKTKVNPNQFEKELGELLKIYTTTISNSTFVLLIFSILVLIIGIAKSIQLIEDFNREFYIWMLITLSMIFILTYFPLAIRFCYVATFENGLVIKKRYKTKIIKYNAIKKIELRNLSILYNYFRTDNAKRLAIDMTLKDNKIVSIGESYRILKLIAYPRIPSSTKIWDIKQLYKEIGSIVNNNV